SEARRARQHNSRLWWRTSRLRSTTVYGGRTPARPEGADHCHCGGDEAGIDHPFGKHPVRKQDHAFHIKRLTRKTMCFSRSTQLHDIVIGLFVNRYEFGLPV